MALSVGITDTASSTPGPVTTGTGKTTTAGSGISVFVSVSGTTQPTIKDGLSSIGGSSLNTWTAVPGAATTFSTASLWHFKNETGTRGANHVFQASGGTDITILVVEVLGTTPVVDVSNNASGDGTSPYGDTATITPTVGDYLLVSGIGSAMGGVNTFTPGSGYTKQSEQNDGNTFWSCASGTKAVTGGAGAQTCSWTDTASGGATGVVTLAWKESAAAAVQAPLLTPLWMHPGRGAVWLKPRYLPDVIVPASIGALSGASVTAAAGTATPITTVALTGQAASTATGTVTVAGASVGNVNIDVNSSPAQGGGVLLTAFADGGSATLGGHGIKALNGVTSATTPGTTTSASGSTFVIDVICQWDGGSLWTISDSKGNTYTQIGVVDNYSGNFDLVRLVKHNGTGGASHTATATCTTTTEVTIFFTEITNCTALAGTSGATNSTVGTVDSTNTVTSPNLNVTDSAAFLLGSFAGDGFGSNYSQTATGYTKIDEETAPGANTAQGATFYKRVVASGAGAVLTGSSVTASAGTLIPNDAVAPSGVVATSAAGTATPGSAIPVTGQAATASAGTSVANLTVPLAGQGVTTAQGTINAGQLLAGQAATFAQGTINAGQTVAGSAATASTGTPGVSLVVPLTGASASTAQGSVSASGASGATLSGSAATSSTGTLAPSITVALTGIALTAAQGTATAALTRAISGSASSAVTGTLVPGVAVGVTGQQAAAVVGNISPAIAALLSHADIVVSQGTVQPASGGVVALTGQAMVASLGTLIALKAGPPGPGFSPRSSGEARPAGLGSVRPAGFTDRRR